jgi:NADPH:quinone reductase
MRSWAQSEWGQPVDVLRQVDVEPPSPGAGQLAIRVIACALGFPDVLMCRNEYQLRQHLPFTPGHEIYGEVVHIADGVSTRAGVTLGSRVISLGTGLHGGLAEIALAEASLTFPAPPRLDGHAAAAMYGTYLTGWMALFHRARMQAGEVLLVQAAGGGVGTAAIQLGLSAGATVIGVVRGDRKAEVVRDLGAHLVIDRDRQSVVDVVREFTGGYGIDVGFDPVGGDAWRECTKLVAFEGRLIPIGFAGGSIPSQPLNHPLVKNYTIIGMSSGRYVSDRPEMVARAHDELYGLVEEGLVSPLVGSRLAFDHAARGLQELGAGVVVGRTVVAVGDD